jgi:hypothetical protein
MPFATIAGVTYQVQNPGAQQQASTLMGAVRRTRNGSARNGVRAGARSWSLTLAPITEAEYLTLEANTARAKFVTVNGDFVDNTATLCWVIISNAQYYKRRSTSPLGRVCSLDIFEVTAESAIVPGPVIRLTRLASSDLSGAYIMSVDGVPNDPFPDFGSITMLAGVDLTTAPIVYSLAPEAKWYSVALAGGSLYGRPVVTILGSGGSAENFSTMATKFKLFLVRGGVDVFSTESNYAGSDLFGGGTTMTGVTRINIATEPSDRVRLEFWSRAGLNPDGPGDSGQRQVFTFGSPYDAILKLGGMVAL